VNRKTHAFKICQNVLVYTILIKFRFNCSDNVFYDRAVDGRLNGTKNCRVKTGQYYYGDKLVSSSPLSYSTSRSSR